MLVFLTGASGLLGRRVSTGLLGRGHRVLALTRGPARREGAVEWISGDPSAAGPWQGRLEGCDAVVHLAGESVGQRWTDTARLHIRDSRLESTRRLVEGLQAARRPPRVLVCASGQDYYPFDDSERAYTESDGPGDSFLARLCVDWEAGARSAERLGLRVAMLRLGVVLAPEGGALEPMARPFRLFAGGPLGSGRQWMGWIHVEDVAAVILRALERESLSGPLNLVAPQALRQADFARLLGAALGRPSILPTPAFALRLILGGFAEHLLQGRRVEPRALLDEGYEFIHSEAGAALRACL